MSTGPATGDLYAHLSPGELAARLRQRYCPEQDIAHLVAYRDRWAEAELINRWLRS